MVVAIALAAIVAAPAAAGERLVGRVAAPPRTDLDYFTTFIDRHHCITQLPHKSVAVAA